MNVSVSIHFMNRCTYFFIINQTLKLSVLASINSISMNKSALLLTVFYHECHSQIGCTTTYSVVNSEQCNKENDCRFFAFSKCL